MSLPEFPDFQPFQQNQTPEYEFEYARPLTML